MLTYERVVKENKIELTYKIQKIVSTDFLIALLIALLLHGFAFLIFNIKDIGLLPHHSLMVNMNVETEPIKFNEVYSVAKNEELVGFLPEPVYAALPALDEMPFQPITDKWEFSAISMTPPNYFSDAVFYEKPLLEKKNFEVHFAHELRYRTFMDLPKETLDWQGGKAYARFRIQVDDRSGKIFWIEAAELSGYAKLDAYALSVLQDLRFEAIDSFITAGEVEFYFDG